MTVHNPGILSSHQAELKNSVSPNALNRADGNIKV
jgi:hypothetical protein